MNLISPQIAMKMMNTNDYKRFVDYSQLFLSTLKKSVKGNGELSDYIYFLPVFSDNSILHKAGIYGKYYFKDLNFTLNEPIVLLWNGPAEYSFSLDGADILRFEKETGKRMVWLDNTLMMNKKYLMEKGNASIYPGKARVGSFFDPYKINSKAIGSDFYNSEALINLPELSPLTLIRLYTAADYLWNPEGYNADLSLWKALVLHYGKETAIELIRFNDLCYGLLYLTMMGETEGLSQKQSRDGEEFIRRINEDWHRISKLLMKQTEFVNQLTDKKNQIISRFSQTRRKRDN
jgi:hypothetical protein